MSNPTISTLKARAAKGQDAIYERQMKITALRSKVRRLEKVLAEKDAEIEALRNRSADADGLGA